MRYFILIYPNKKIREVSLSLSLAPEVGFEHTGVISSHKFSRLGAYDRLRTPAYGVLNPIYITFPFRDK